MISSNNILKSLEETKKSPINFFKSFENSLVTTNQNQVVQSRPVIPLYENAEYHQNRLTKKHWNIK